MKRYFMAFIGVVLIGFSVAVLNLSGFGVDPFSCMNMSVSAHLPFSFGVWQIFVNAVILMLLIIHVIKEKKKIGAVFGFGTLWNMTGVGLLVDFFTTKYHISVSYTHLDVYKRQYTRYRADAFRSYGQIPNSFHQVL